MTRETLLNDNKILRNSLEDFLFINESSKEEILSFWVNVNDLIENEIQQEKRSNQ